jgi:retinol dehydrogenase-13
MEEESDYFITYAGIAVAAFTVLALIRYYIKGAQFREKVNAKGKVVLITGANSGIGKQLVRELNLRGAKIYMLCRNEERGVEAKRELSMKVS